MRTLMLLVATSLMCFGADHNHSKAEEEDIHEAVLRYQVKAWYSDSGLKPDDKDDKASREIKNRLTPMIVHIQIDGKDPSAQFLERFKSEKFIFRPASEAGKKEMGKPSVMPSGKIIFSSENIKWLSETHVEVSGGYYCGSLCASGNTFQVNKKNGKWEVTSARMNWIS